MHYFLIYKKISELLFQKVTPVTLFYHLLTDKSPVPMLGKIGSTEALCALCENDVTVVLD